MITVQLILDTAISSAYATTTTNVATSNEATAISNTAQCNGRSEPIWPRTSAFTFIAVIGLCGMKWNFKSEKDSVNQMCRRRMLHGAINVHGVVRNFELSLGLPGRWWRAADWEASEEIECCALNVSRCCPASFAEHFWKRSSHIYWLASEMATGHFSWGIILKRVTRLYLDHSYCIATQE